MTPESCTTNTCAKIQIPPDACLELAAVFGLFAKIDGDHDISRIEREVRERLRVLSASHRESGTIVAILSRALEVAGVGCSDDGK